MQKFTLPAGTTNRHQWHKQAAKAIESVSRTFNMMRQLHGTDAWDKRESLVSVFSFGDDQNKNTKAVELYQATGERFGWTITRDNADDIAKAFKAILPDCMASVPVEDNRKTADELADQAARVKAAKEREQAQAEKAETVESLAADIRKAYPWAEARGNKSEQARAAANLKRLLQRHGLECSVKSSSFSMGDSVTATVKTPDIAPEVRKELDELAERFSYSTFDPMTDYSDYKRDPEGEAWREVFGKTKYCRIEWTQSDENRAAILAFLDADESGEAYRVYSGAHCRAAEFWAQWAETHAPQTASRDFDIVAAGYSIEQHTHTKKGFDMFLVIPSERVERDELNQLRNAAKPAGGWYSRKWGKTPGGFAFKEQESAEQFAADHFTAQQVAA